LSNLLESSRVNDDDGVGDVMRTTLMPLPCQLVQVVQVQVASTPIILISVFVLRLQPPIAVSVDIVQPSVPLPNSLSFEHS
jgi:hypothetical protein